MSFVGLPYFCFVASGGIYVLAIWVIQSDFSKSQNKDFQTVRSDYLHIYMLSVTFGFQISRMLSLFLFHLCYLVLFLIPTITNRQGDRAWGDTSGSEQLRLTIPEALLGFSPT